MRLLLAEDEPALANWLVQALRQSDFRVHLRQAGYAWGKYRRKCCKYVAQLRMPSDLDRPLTG